MMISIAGRGVPLPEMGSIRRAGLVLVSGMLLLAGCQNSAPLVERDGYYTWVDESGQVRSTPVPRSQAEPDLEPAGHKTDQTGTTDRTEKSDSPVVTTPSDSSSPARTTPDSEYNLDNYPDANELEASGYVRPGDPLPYYTWRDAEGRFRSSYYRPDTRSDVEKGLIREPVTLTPASVYQASGASGSKNVPTLDPDPATRPEAFALLGISTSAKSYLDQWQGACCHDLTLSDTVEWSSGREFQVEFQPDTPVHSFFSGSSAYRLVRLPDPAETRSLIIRIRSFAQNGILVPSVAFLDESLRPLRLVTDMIMDFTPESWHRQAYLEAHVPAFPERRERWLLIYTRDEDLAGQTVIETRRGPKALHHRDQGLISLTEIQP